MKHTLASLIESGLSYDNTVAIYAEGQYPDVSVRFGQTQFENGGLLDGKEMVGTCMEIIDYLNSWTDGDDDVFEHVGWDDFVQALFDYGPGHHYTVAYPDSDTAGIEYFADKASAIEAAEMGGGEWEEHNG